MVTADMVVLNPDRKAVLLVQRGREPYKGCWALPGGFFDMDDLSTEQTALRELQEETGLSGVEDVQLLTVASAPGRDPRGRTLSVVYTAVAVAGQHVSGGDDAREARWWPLEALPPLAFDHDELVHLALQRLLSPSDTVE